MLLPDGTKITLRKSFRCAGDGALLYFREHISVCLAAMILAAGLSLRSSDPLVRAAVAIGAATLLGGHMMQIAIAALAKKLPPQEKVSPTSIARQTLTIRGWKNSLNERNMRLHSTVAPLVIATGALVGLSAQEWIPTLLVIAEIIAGESANTVIEDLSDRHFGWDDDIRAIKDLAAGAVLVPALSAAYFAYEVFLPKMIVFVMALL